MTPRKYRNKVQIEIQRMNRGSAKNVLEFCFVKCFDKISSFYGKTPELLNKKKPKKDEYGGWKQWAPQFLVEFFWLWGGLNPVALLVAYAIERRSPKNWRKKSCYAENIKKHRLCDKLRESAFIEMGGIKFFWITLQNNLRFIRTTFLYPRKGNRWVA